MKMFVFRRIVLSTVSAKDETEARRILGMQGTIAEDETYLIQTVDYTIPEEDHRILY